jgi:serine/threonine-protein kinase
MVEVGQTVGNYRVLERIAQGSVGDVYLAEHPVIGRKTALKVIHPQHTRNVDVLARFVNEASALSRLGHKHIVGVTDFGRTPAGDFYFVMEYLDGRSLADLIVAEAPLAPARALELAAQIADALTAAHAHGIIHRDLKPENVFLVKHRREPDFVKVLDFGLAKLLEHDGAAPRETRARGVMGTAYYMAPEQCERGREVDGRTDVYALGITLFEMLTGKLPFGGDSDAEVLMKQMKTPAPAVRSLVPEAPAALDAIVRRALAKAPADRFPTMAAFGEALLAPGGHVPLFAARADEDAAGVLRDARPMSRAEIMLNRAPPAPPPAEPQPSAPASRPTRRAVSLVGAAALASLSLLAGGTLWWMNRQTPTSARTGESAPATVALTFNSDPDGATVVGPEGAVLGTTPLSIQVARAQTPVAFIFQKAGFETKTMSLIPDAPSSVFAAMQAKRRTGDRRRAGASSTSDRHGGTARRAHDEDDVLAPPF